MKQPFRFLRRPHVSHHAPKVKLRKPKKLGRCPACLTSIFEDDTTVLLHGKLHHRECVEYTRAQS